VTLRIGTIAGCAAAPVCAATSLLLPGTAAAGPYTYDRELAAWVRTSLEVASTSVASGVDGTKHVVERASLAGVEADLSYFVTSRTKTFDYAGKKTSYTEPTSQRKPTPSRSSGADSVEPRIRSFRD
jgi:hypothetical protein